MKECPSCFHENPDTAKACQECGYEFTTGFGSEGTRMAPVEITAFSKGDLIAGRYRVERELGRGGMGVVYLVSDTELRDERVAVKMIHPHLLANSEASGRFADEVLISQKLTQPSIVRVHDLKRWEGLRFFTMEYINGRSLREWITGRMEKKPPFTLPEAISLMNPLLDALSYAHQYTIHRDVKPENIMVTGDFPDIGIKVLDFGIAKTLSASWFTHTAQALGTAYYMAPEQMRGKKIDHRADLFAVGMILYEMLMGQVAVGIPELPSRVYPELPGEMDGIVGRLLKRDPNDRYPDARAVKDALARAIANRERALGERRKEEERRGREKDLEDLLRQGQARYDSRDWKEAEKIYNNILERNPEHREARDLVKKVRDKEGTRLDLMKQLEAAKNSDALEQAISLLKKIIPLSAEETFLKSKQTFLEQALEEQKETQRQEKIASLTREALSLFKSRKWSEAEEALYRIQSLAPKQDTVGVLLEKTREKKAELKGLLDKADAAEKRGDHEIAITTIEKAILLSDEEKALEETKVRLKKALCGKRQEGIELQKRVEYEKEVHNVNKWQREPRNSGSELDEMPEKKKSAGAHKWEHYVRVTLYPGIGAYASALLVNYFILDRDVLLIVPVPILAILLIFILIKGSDFRTNLMAVFGCMLGFLIYSFRNESDNDLVTTAIWGCLIVSLPLFFGSISVLVKKVIEIVAVEIRKLRKL